MVTKFSSFDQICHIQKEIQDLKYSPLKGRVSVRGTLAIKVRLFCKKMAERLKKIIVRLYITKDFLLDFFFENTA